MESRNTIVNELNAISPTLAGMEPQNPYEVPAGYFEGFAGQVMQKIKANNPTYQVPEGYFEGLAETILNRIKADTAGSAKEELEILSPLLNKIGKKTPFSTPDGYFGELTDNVIAGAKAIEFVNEELENLSPVMNSLKGKTVYEVPAGYFEQLPQQVLTKAKGQQPVKVVSMTFTRKVMQYAVAAVIAGAVIVAGWMYLGGNNQPVQPEDALAKEVRLISDSSLLSYIENPDALLAETTAIDNFEISENDMKDMLTDVSDDELQQYVEKYNIAKAIYTN